MTEHLGDDYLATLRQAIKGFKAVPSQALSMGINGQTVLDLEGLVLEVERYRQLGTWDLPQHDGWWLDRDGRVHHINVSGLTGERSEWFYRQLGPWREIKEYSEIINDMFETNASSKATGRTEIITEVRALLDTLEGKTA